MTVKWTFHLISSGVLNTEVLLGSRRRGTSHGMDTIFMAMIFFLLHCSIDQAIHLGDLMTSTMARVMTRMVHKSNMTHVIERF